MDELASVPDSVLIAHALRWRANETETGNGSVSAEERREARERLLRRGLDASQLKEPALTPHDAEYVCRLRAIAKQYETHSR